MWNEKKSILLSRACVYSFMVLALVGVAFGYFIIEWFLSFSRAPLQGTQLYFLLTYYSGAFFVIITLLKLNMLLKNISLNKIFIKQNVSLIRVCSWCCIAIGIICFVSGIYYFPFFIISVFSVFMGLILRIIKNIFERAIIIKEENEFTI